MSGTAPVTEVNARPILMARVGWACAVTMWIAGTTVAVLLGSDKVGAPTGLKDQIGMFVVGVIVGGLFIMLTRPRLHADTEALRMRSFLGGWRTVPWSVVVRVEFPSSVRFARIVLPGDETLSLYAVQRVDREQAVDVMRGLRALFAATHPQG